MSGGWSAGQRVRARWLGKWWDGEIATVCSHGCFVLIEGAGTYCYVPFSSLKERT